MRFSSESAAVAEIQKLEASYWRGTSQNPSVSIAPGVKAQFKGGASQSAYEWTEGSWTFIAMLDGPSSTVKSELNSVIKDIRDSGIPRIHETGAVVIVQHGQSVNMFDVHAAWVHGNTSWSLEGQGVLEGMLNEIRSLG